MNWTAFEQHRFDDVHDLSLQAHRYPGINVPVLVVQISGWQKARKKLPLWAETDHILFPPQLSMEQCSSELTARYKACVIERIFAENGLARDSFTDLTAGFGVDATLIGRLFGSATLVERQQQLCEIAENNLPLLGVKNYNVVCGDSIDYFCNVMPRQNLVFIDPARRDANGHKTVLISDCTPDVCSINGALLDKADFVMLKLSPMLDIANIERELSSIREIHVVSVDGECKEVLVVLSKRTACDVTMHCIDIASNTGICNALSFTREEERIAECQYADAIGSFLYEPNASIMKAAAFKTLAKKYGLKKLHPSSHLYTNSELIDNFPGRIFAVEAVSSFNKKELKRMLPSETKKANITVRNFPSSVAELRKRLKLSEGGSIYLFATTLADESHILISCSKV